MARKSVDGNASDNNETDNGIAATGGNSDSGNEQPAIIAPADLAGSAGNDGSGIDEFERDEFGNVKIGSNGKPRKRRGRKPGGSGGQNSGKSSAPRKASENNLSGIEAILFSLHSMAAAALTVPELALEQKEAAQLAIALAAVADHYPLTIAPKTMAWVNLVMASSAIYGPRIYLYRQRMAKEKAQKDGANDVVANSLMPGGFAMGASNLQ